MNPPLFANVGSLSKSNVTFSPVSGLVGLSSEHPDVHKLIITAPETMGNIPMVRMNCLRST
jgi:hypothetical protein